MSEEERRKNPRYFIRILVDYSASDTFLYDYSSDMSEGGIFIQTKNPLEKGEQIDLRFTLPGLDRIFQLKGEVAWVNKQEKEEGKEIDSEEALGDALDDLLDATTQKGKEEGKPGMAEGMGIRFMDLSSEDETVLKDFLSKQHY